MVLRQYNNVSIKSEANRGFFPKDNLTQLLLFLYAFSHPTSDSLDFGWLWLFGGMRNDALVGSIQRWLWNDISNRRCFTCRKRSENHLLHGFLDFSLLVLFWFWTTRTCTIFTTSCLDGHVFVRFGGWIFLFTIRFFLRSRFAIGRFFGALLRVFSRFFFWLGIIQWFWTRRRRFM